MKSSFVLCFTVSNAETIFEMIDRFFNIYTDFVSFFPFLRSPFYAGISTEIFLRIDIDHSSAGRSGTWIVTVAYPAFRLVGRVVFPFHFGTYKFHSRKFAF